MQGTIIERTLPSQTFVDRQDVSLDLPAGGEGGLASIGMIR